MSNNKSIIGYLGKGFQLKVFWQILTNEEFAEDTLPLLDATYFDDDSYKRLITILKDYQDKNEKPSSIKNKSVDEAIQISFLNDIEKETLMEIIGKVTNWEMGVLSGKIPYDGDVVRENLFNFVKQEEYKKLASGIFEMVEKGDIKESVEKTEERIQKISNIGEREDLGHDVFDMIDDVMEKDFRKPISTGLKALNEVMGGGLGGGEMAIILAPLGVGKTSLLTKLSNVAFNEGKNVLQIFFEDTYKQIMRKHFCIWSKVGLSDMDQNREYTLDKVKEFYNEDRFNKLILKKFPQDEITMPKIKNWILNYQKRTGTIFDIVILDYVDCIESHKNNYGNELKDELDVIKSFESMLAELDVPGWSAIQGNRTSISAKYVQTDHMGGSIKKAQKSHFLMSISKSWEQKQAGLANAVILKSRFGTDGMQYENFIFNNGNMDFHIDECHLMKGKVKEAMSDDEQKKLNESVSTASDNSIPAIDYKEQLKNIDTEVNEDISPEKIVERQPSQGEITSSDFEEISDVVGF